MPALLDAYVRGTLVWLPRDGEVEDWIAGEVLEKKVIHDRIRIVVMDERGEESIIETHKDSLDKSLPPLRNPPHLNAVDDLTQLTHLNEPSVIYTIQNRYSNKIIYTYSGIVLIAVNPFEHIDLYGPEMIRTYSSAERNHLEPHLFAIAEEAFRCMIREQRNQTIIVSGESGAGKTMSAKFIMRYFASASGRRMDEETGSSEKRGAAGVEEQILATNPIMEAFGNAKTTRNDNSSRFGKYIKIQFDDRANIIGAKLDTYLLERSRLVYQPDTERNYHIFYQLCAGASVADRELLGLTSHDHFHYLNQGGVASIQGVDDALEFSQTQLALSTIGIDEDTQRDMFRLLAALLHIGNIAITGRNEALVSEEDPRLEKACQLLGIPPAGFKKWIIKRQISTRSEKIVTALQPAQAVVVRDSVVKYVYANLFDWLVAHINLGLSRGSPVQGDAFIGVLDIYGFEHFTRNSFEQLCINYANEKLQREFNEHVFRLEQEDYLREDIAWEFIEFSDNLACIDMIESRMGILSLLDEESRMPSGSDAGLCTKLYQQFDTPSAKYFRRPRFGGGNAFTIVHYAHEVTYEVDGFLEKNRDTLPEEHLALLQDSDFDFVRGLVAHASSRASSPSSANSSPVAPAGGNGRGPGTGKKPATLGSIFKASLVGLMEVVRSTQVHYIRCVKPNEQKSAWEFDRAAVLAQLRACGVLETIKISCAGFPAKWRLEDFWKRFGMLVPKQESHDLVPLGAKEKCESVLESTHTKDPEMYRIGKTKIFLRSNLLAVLEGYRAAKLDEAVVVLQKYIRRFVYRRRYLRILLAVVRLQCFARRCAARRILGELRAQKKGAIALQKLWRGYKVRKELQQQHVAAENIQRVYRGWVTRRRYKEDRRKIIVAQSCIRRYLATKEWEKRREAFLARLEREEQANKARATQEATVLRDTLREQESRAMNGSGLEPYRGEHLANFASPRQSQGNAKRNGGSSLLDNRLDHISEDEALRARAHHLESRVRAWIEKYSRLERVWKEMEEAYMNAHGPLSPGSREGEQALGKERRAGVNGMNAVNGASGMAPHPHHQDFERYSPLHLSASFAERIHGHLSSKWEDPARELQQLLCQEGQSLRDEIVEGLIRGCRLPPLTHAAPSVFEIIFPARVISLALVQLWRMGLRRDAEQLVADVIRAVQEQCFNHRGEEIAILMGAYWLRNVLELHTLLSDRPRLDPSSEVTRQHLARLAAQIYGEWVRELRSRFGFLVIPCIVESQSLAYFVVASGAQNGRPISTSSLSSTSSPVASAFDYSGDEPPTIQFFLRALNRLRRVMHSYCLYAPLAHRVLTDLLSMTGAIAFNELLDRRGFSCWKRAVQIQHNVVRIQEWCKAHEVHPNVMEPVRQATHALQGKKTNVKELPALLEECWCLNGRQLLRLLERYHVADYEAPVAPELLAAVRRRVKESDRLHLPMIPSDPREGEVAIGEVLRAEKAKTRLTDGYIPEFLALERVQRLVSLCASLVDTDEEASYQKGIMA
ncbi:uncharacterized protein VTP21DRAFT_11290 [Calcarisporiella thermophila]|uniref:uncharacterized protein n=1 Tax=Calcarisporiella thermophila TaxID=911321 RepID=UPI0037447881